ncbi:hypothetical protein [Brevundimonas sp.]|uniref:hypothetical protein n=1 Tax=Brevundimonas sp. TaxID=1871086 RepID=UPI00286C1772|nr:hypothetical protein [Brevundimonas sp.]
MKQATLLALILATPLAACATMDPGTGAGAIYALPRTDATVTLNLRLTSCQPFAAEGAVSLTPTPGAQAQTYQINGSDLTSRRVRRSVKIGVNAAGAITQVNASASDRTAQIAASVVKTAVTLAPVFALDGSSQTPECRPDVAAALARADRIQNQIRDIRAELGENFSGPERDLPDRRQRRLAEALPSLITELATLQTGILRLSLSRRVAIDAVPTAQSQFPVTHGIADLDVTALTQWYLGETDAEWRAAFAPYLAFSWSAEKLARTPVEVSSWRGASDNQTRRVEPCNLDMPIPAPAQVRVSVRPPTGIGLESPIPPLIMHAAQWSMPASLCLNAAFGETRSVEMTFDDFGRTTAFAWVSEASGEAMSVAAAGAAADLAGYWRSQTDVAQQQSELLALETQQKLNRLRACEAIIAAGGYTCPP